MTIILIFIFTGYLFSRLLEKDKSSLAHIILFSLGIMGLVSFFNILIWNFISLYGVLILNIPIILIITAIIIYSGKNFLAPIECSISDIIILGILFLLGLQQLYGYWDAWAMWNTKANFLISGHWKMIFSKQINWMHPDYPLLLPSIIAGGWSALNTTSPIVPLLVALFFSWSICLLLKNSISRFLNKTYGILSSLLIISIPAFTFWSRSQYADILLAAFILLGVLILLESRDYSTILISGLALGFAVFTKNEGIIYLGIILLSYIYSSWRVNNKIPFKSAILLIVGAFPGILSSLIIKNYAVQNEFISNFSKSLSLLTFHKVALIVKGFIYEFVNWREWMLFWILIALFIVFTNKRQIKIFQDVFLTSLIILSFIFFVFSYLVTPKDVVWHIQTSFNRLLIQILPICLLLVFIRLKIFRRIN